MGSTVKKNICAKNLDLEMGSAWPKNCATVSIAPVLTVPRW
jgi:hypothetical protein